jgi:tetratricopeptide (TPR) repeat protein
LDALEARRRELPSRHQSLRAAFAASFGLLPTEAQHFFAALALFRGGFDATAARAVTEDSYTLHHIAQLRGASLLTDAPSAAHEARFRLLEPLREFAEEQLLPETRHELAARHGRHFSEVVMRAAEEWHTEKSNSWLEQLDAEQDNLRAALAWNLAHQPHEALRMAVAVAPFWEARGRFREALGALDSTLNGALNGTTGDQDALAQTRVRAHSSAAHLAFLVGDLASARTHVDSALPLARQNGDKRSELHALRHHVLIKVNEGDVAGALTHRDSMRALSEQIGEPRVWAEVLFILGSALVAMRDAHVVPLAEECMQLFTALEDRLQIGMTYDLRAYARLAIDDGDGALHDWQTALEIGRECGAAYLIYKSLRQLGVLTARSGDFAQARLIMREAGEFLPQTQSAYFAAYFWECCAYIAAGEGRAAQAAQLIGAAQALRKAIGHPLLPIFLPDHEHFIARARATIGADDFEAELTVGHTLNESAAMALAWAELEIA